MTSSSLKVITYATFLYLLISCLILLHLEHYDKCYSKHSRVNKFIDSHSLHFLRHTQSNGFDIRFYSELMYMGTQHVF